MIVIMIINYYDPMKVNQYADAYVRILRSRCDSIIYSYIATYSETNNMFVYSNKLNKEQVKLNTCSCNKVSRGRKCK